MSPHTGARQLEDSRELNGVSGGSFRSHASDGLGSPGDISSLRQGASGFDADASIAYSDIASDIAGKPRSTKLPVASKHDTSDLSGTLSQNNLEDSIIGKSGAKPGSVDGGSDREESASVSGSVLAPSERSRASQPRALTAPPTTSGHPVATGGGDSHLASEDNFAFGEAEDDAASAVSKSSVAPAYRSPSLTASGNGHNSRPTSGLSPNRSEDAGHDQRPASAAGSDLASKPRSLPVPLGTGGVGISNSNLGFSGFSMPSDKSSIAEEDSESTVMQRSTVAGSSRKPSEQNGTAMGGVSRLSEEGVGRSARITSNSDLSYDKYDDDATLPAPATTRRRSSFASSLRQSVASHKAASPPGSDDGDGYGRTEPDGGAAPSSRSSYSAVSSKDRSAVSGPSVRSARSGAQSSSVRSAETSRSRSSGAAAAKREEYDEDKFEEEEVVDFSDDESQRGQKEPVDMSTSAGLSESVAAASTITGAGSGGGGGDAPSVAGSSKRQPSASGGRPTSASSRQSSRSAAPSSAMRPAAAAVASIAANYSQEFDAPIHSGRHTPVSLSISAVPTNDGSDPRHHHHHHRVDDDDGAASNISAAIRSNPGSHPPTAVSLSGSIFQPPPSEGTTPSSRGGRSGVSVFRRLPADAPDEEPTTSLPTRAASVRSSTPDNDEWNEGAVRIAAPGMARLSAMRLGGEASAGATAAAAAGTRVRPMSAAARDRQAALLDGLIRKHPATWDTVDVATWVDFMGLGQYRRRFLHHCIDGRLLLRLNDAQLKSDLGIGPVGHRVAIMDAAANLTKSYKEAQRDRAAAGEGDGNDSDGRQEMQRSSTAPRPRPASARPGALSMPPPPAAGARRPASASRSVIPPDPFLGPAMGKVTVYEQRAKLLFELDRAQARAEQHRVLADQLRYTATLSSEEVAHIRGLLLDIEKKNRAAFDTAAGVDSAARIPWRHVGNGTKHGNWYPERFGRPGDPETVDLTFQPRTNQESRKMLGGGDYGENSNAVNSFLDRLNNDLRKREQTKKELEKRYYSDGANPQTQAEQDFSIVAEQLQSRCRIGLEHDPSEYELQIDEALEKLRTGESWREAGLREGPIRAAKGPAKIAAFATALRSLSFMERYRSDLRSKGSRLKTLENKWINQTLGAQYLPGGKDKEDMDEATKFFALLGWRDSDGSPSEDAIDSDLLDRLLERALEYRKRFDAWWERVRDKPEERAAGFKCDVNWLSSPWDRDGLGQLMEAEMKRMGDGGRRAGGTGGPGGDFVDYTIALLGKSREDDLRRLLTLGARPKRLGVYRAIRTQKFIEFTQRDLEERDRKLREAYNALAPQRKQVEPSRIEGFFERLVEDAARRRAKAEKAEHDKVLKEKEILGSSVMYGRLRSGR